MSILTVTLTLTVAPYGMIPSTIILNSQLESNFLSRL